MVSATLHLYSKQVHSYEPQTHTFLLRSRWRLVNAWEILNNPLVFVWVATWAQEGLEELSHVEGQEGRW